MEWSDAGYVLTTQKHGENAVILSALTETRGRQRGLVRGGAGRRHRGLLQTGNLVALRWRGRLAEHLGAFTCELIRSSDAIVTNHPDSLAVLGAASGVIEALLPEGETHPSIYDGLAGLLSALDDRQIISAYIHWELGVLGELGFGLDLSACAATGATDDLIYVSPKSGRAVSAAAGAPYKGKLLSLPAFILESGATDDVEALLNGLGLAGYFLDQHALAGGRNRLSARDRLVERLSRKATSGRP